MQKKEASPESQKEKLSYVGQISFRFNVEEGPVFQWFEGGKPPVQRGDVLILRMLDKDILRIKVMFSEDITKFTALEWFVDAQKIFPDLKAKKYIFDAYKVEREN